MELENLRRNYQEGAADLSDMCPNPLEQFQRWFEIARDTPSSEWFEVNAMTLATAGADGAASARIVLLKKFSSAGFIFFTNYESAKAREIAENPRACLSFYWPHVEKQVRVSGSISKTGAQTSDEYFHARPRESQIGAVVSPQSQPLASRQELEAAVERVARELGDAPVPRPDNWGGYLLAPYSIEFWQGRPSRLHDRFLYQLRDDHTWALSRLAP